MSRRLLWCTLALALLCAAAVMVSAQRTRDPRADANDKKAEAAAAAADAAASAGKNYYELLGIEQSAEEKDIRKAYRRAALTAHPDKLAPGTSDAEREAQRQVFLRISNAHDILSDKETRKRYDWLLTRGIVDYNDRLDWTGFEGGKASRSWRPRTYEEHMADLKRMDDDEMWAFVVSMAGAACVAALPLLYALQRKWNKAKAVASAKADLRDEQRLVNEKLKLIAELKAEEDAQQAEDAKQRRAERDAQRAKEKAERKAAAEGEGEEGAQPSAASKGFKCDLCGNKYKSAGQLEQHNNSAAHKKAVKEAERAKAKATAAAGGKKPKPAKAAAAAAAAADGEDDDGSGSGSDDAAAESAAKSKSKAAAKAAAKNKKKAALAAAAEEVADEAGSSSAAANAADEPDEEMAALKERMKAKRAAAKAKAAGVDGDAAATAADGGDGAGKRHKKSKKADAEAEPEAEAEAEAAAEAEDAADD